MNEITNIFKDDQEYFPILADHGTVEDAVYHAALKHGHLPKSKVENESFNIVNKKIYKIHKHDVPKLIKLFEGLNKRHNNAFQKNIDDIAYHYSSIKNKH